MKLNRVLAVAVLAFAVFSMNAKAQTVLLTSFGHTWDTTSGAQITAHGGQILKIGSTYYWIGEVDSSGGGFEGINCYSSTNLTSWTLVGDILPPQSSGDLATSDLVERPKVLYTSSTGLYVMWMHIWNGDAVGYATSSSVCGTYTYKGSSQPLGNESFDIGAPSLQDTNGDAYLLSANFDKGIIVYLMNSDYLSPASIVDPNTTWGDFEAPAMFKEGGYYFILMSHQTGWSSNDNVYSYATAIGGPWSTPVDIAVSGHKHLQFANHVCRAGDRLRRDNLYVHGRPLGFQRYYQFNLCLVAAENLRLHDNDALGKQLEPEYNHRNLGHQYRDAHHRRQRPAHQPKQRHVSECGEHD